MRIILIGKGKMGKVFYERYEEEIVGWADTPNEIKSLNVKGDVVIDFSHPSLLETILNYVKEENVPLVIATTGYSASEETKIREMARVLPICKDSNFSFGILKVKEVIKILLMQFYGKIEMIETHHINKKDAPSGTALSIRKIIQDFGKEVRIISVRKGEEIGKHCLKFVDEDEIIEIKHTALNKNIFVDGAYLAAERLINKDRGFYDFKEVLHE